MIHEVWHTPSNLGMRIQLYRSSVAASTISVNFMNKVLCWLEYWNASLEVLFVVASQQASVYNARRILSNKGAWGSRVQALFPRA